MTPITEVLLAGLFCLIVATLIIGGAAYLIWDFIKFWRSL